MLDISPPTRSEKSSRSSTPQPGHGFVLVPKDGVDDNNWSHVDKGAASLPVMTRRKTTLEHRSGKYRCLSVHPQKLLAL